MLTGKENVIDAMKSGARFFSGGGNGVSSRLMFEDGSVRLVHGKTVQAVDATGLIRLKNKFDPWSLMSEEFVLKEGGA
jgi:hypothetical protein